MRLDLPRSLDQSRWKVVALSPLTQFSRFQKEICRELLTFWAPLRKIVFLS